jgi:hypothetical protein
MTSPAQNIFNTIELFVDEPAYTLVKLPPRAIMAAAGVLADWGEPFGTVIADKDEVTLILPVDAWPEYESRLPDAQQAGRYRLITFEDELSLDLVGFMALVSNILAEANVTIMSYAAFSRDHLLVPEEQLDDAVQALKNAQKNS